MSEGRRPMRGWLWSSIGYCAAVLAIGAAAHAQERPDTILGQPSRVEIRLALLIGDTLVDREGYWFQSVAGVAPTSTGEIVVLDSGQKQAFRYDGEARFVGAFGRPGSGPGEFQSADRMDVRADTIRIFDAMQQRWSEFDLGGNHVRTVRHPELAGGRRVAYARPMRGGRTLRVTVEQYVRGGPDHAPFVTVRLSSTDGRDDELVHRVPGDAVLWYPARGGATPWGLGTTPFGMGGGWSVLGDSLIVVADGHAGLVRWWRIRPAHGH